MLILHSLGRTRLKPLHTLFLLSLALCSPALGYAQQGKAASPGNCTHPDPATRSDCPGAIAFLAKFQDALKRNDRKAVASLVNYPLLAAPDDKTHIRSRVQLLANFDRVFNPQVRSAILNATAGEVWGNSRGFMIGSGVIWFDGIIPRNEHPDISTPNYGTKYPFKIITVNSALP
jgi:hypothetical protein